MPSDSRVAEKQAACAGTELELRLERGTTTNTSRVSAAAVAVTQGLGPKQGLSLFRIPLLYTPTLFLMFTLFEAFD